MSKNHQDKIFSGLFWKFAERILAQGISFVVSILLARLLAPEAYGIVAMVMVFINIANIFVTGGFSQALIQKKDADETDFSTIFHCSFVLSLLIYGICWLAAPYIAAFYNTPELTTVFRVFSLKLPISAYNSIQHAYVSRHMLFKRFFYSTLFGTLVSAAVGVVMAFMGFGVWALVAQYLVNSAIDTLVLAITVPWRPRMLFSTASARSLMRFGWKCLAANLIGTIYSNIRSLVIGKFYTAEDLAYYSKGKHFPDLIMDNVVTSITSVLFPALSQHSDDPAALKGLTQKSIRCTAYVVFPMMAGMLAVARPMILLLLTEKWADCVIYLQMVCIYNALRALSQTNLQAITAMGRSDIVLKLEFIKKPVSISLIFLALPFGVEAVAASLPVSGAFTMAMNMLPNRDLMGYGFREQIADVAAPLWMSAVMAAVVLPIQRLPLPLILVLVLQITAGAAIYVSLSLITKDETFYLLKKQLLGKLVSKKRA